MLEPIHRRAQVEQDSDPLRPAAPSLEVMTTDEDESYFICGRPGSGWAIPRLL